LFWFEKTKIIMGREKHSQQQIRVSEKYKPAQLLNLIGTAFSQL
jgi:hypothetical protein